VVVVVVVVVVNAPGAAKGGCCFLGTSRSPGRTGSGDCVVISLHLRLFGPTKWRTERREGARERGERERERARCALSREKRRRGAMPGERAQHHRPRG